MPARKNRSGKFRGAHATPPKPPTANELARTGVLVRKFLAWEQAKPGVDHYVGWGDMREARQLEKAGYLRQGSALGCFFLTDSFRSTFG